MIEKYREIYLNTTCQDHILSFLPHLGLLPSQGLGASLTRRSITDASKRRKGIRPRMNTLLSIGIINRSDVSDPIPSRRAPRVAYGTLAGSKPAAIAGLIVLVEAETVAGQPS